MKFSILPLLFIFFQSSLAAKAETLDSLFSRVPEEVMPIFDRTNKLDLLDLYNCNLPATVENKFGGKSQLLEKNETYLKLQTTSVGTWQMKLLGTAQNSLILTVHTLKAGGSSSTLKVYDLEWNEMEFPLPHPSLKDFLVPSLELSEDEAQDLETVLSMAPMEAEWNDSLASLVCSVSISGLSREDKEKVSSILKPIFYDWNGEAFIPIPSKPVEEE